jgi:hypothetical protein
VIHLQRQRFPLLYLFLPIIPSIYLLIQLQWLPDVGQRQRQQHPIQVTRQTSQFISHVRITLIFFQVFKAVYDLVHNFFPTAFIQTLLTSSRALAMFRMAW